MSDIHALPFSDETLIKLDLYNKYLYSWLPTFVHSQMTCDKKINIYDYFAGPGRDSTGKAGSPALAIDAIKDYAEDITNKKRKIDLYLNEYKPIKFKSLQRTIDAEKDSAPCNVHYSNNDFASAFNELYPTMQGNVNLLFLDQSGIKHIDPRTFKRIVKTPHTDFIFFIASSYIARFGGMNEFKQFSTIPKEKICGENFYNVHREVLNFYKAHAPKDYYLSAFSIAKGSNIYGLIFGSGHLKGISKFLEIAWKIDPNRGEANFDIDRENLDSPQLDMFSTNRRPKKLELFESELKNAIKSNELKTDEDIVKFSLEHGFLPKHARDIIKPLTDNNIIKFNGRRRISLAALDEPRSFEVINYDNL